MSYDDVTTHTPNMFMWELVFCVICCIQMLENPLLCCVCLCILRVVVPVTGVMCCSLSLQTNVTHLQTTVTVSVSGQDGLKGQFGGEES